MIATASPPPMPALGVFCILGRQSRQLPDSQRRRSDDEAQVAVPPAVCRSVALLSTPKALIILLERSCGLALETVPEERHMAVSETCA
jgi:hypothetical protein